MTNNILESNDSLLTCFDRKINTEKIRELQATVNESIYSQTRHGLTRPSATTTESPTIKAFQWITLILLTSGWGPNTTSIPSIH